jgi:hypothetical protein
MPKISKGLAVALLRREGFMLTHDMTRILKDPSASSWLKMTITSSLQRDPVDAANDAEVLSQLLQARAEAILIEDSVMIDRETGRPSAL